MVNHHELADLCRSITVNHPNYKWKEEHEYIIPELDHAESYVYEDNELKIIVAFSCGVDYEFIRVFYKDQLVYEIGRDVGIEEITDIDLVVHIESDWEQKLIEIDKKL